MYLAIEPPPKKKKMIEWLHKIEKIKIKNKKGCKVGPCKLSTSYDIENQSRKISMNEDK